MKKVDMPDKFQIPWANNAGSSYIRTIPKESHIGITDGRASLADGWVPLNFVDEVAGGVAPSGADDNGIKKQITENIRWQSAGMFPQYDATFSTAIGGYPEGSILLSADLAGLWQSLVDDNTSNPDTGGANWASCIIQRDEILALIPPVSSISQYQNYKALSVGINNDLVVITCDSAILINSAGQGHKEKTISLTIDSGGTVGSPLSIMSGKLANKIYYVWFWYNETDGLTATLDISSTTPTAPTGYVSTDYMSRMPGFVLTDSTADKYLMQTVTTGDLTTYRPLTGSNTPTFPVIYSGTLGSLTAVNWRGYAPPTQRELIIRAGGGGSRNIILVAPNSGYTDMYGGNPCPIILDWQSTSEGVQQSVIQPIITESNNIYVMASGATSYVSIFGCRDNI